MDCDNNAVDEAFQMKVKGGSRARYRIGSAPGQRLQKLWTHVMEWETWYATPHVSVCMNTSQYHYY
jgi:hypothetical protein